MIIGIIIAIIISLSVSVYIIYKTSKNRHDKRNEETMIKEQLKKRQKQYEFFVTSLDDNNFEERLRKYMAMDYFERERLIEYALKQDKTEFFDPHWLAGDIANDVDICKNEGIIDEFVYFLYHPGYIIGQEFNIIEIGPETKTTIKKFIGLLRENNNKFLKTKFWEKDWFYDPNLYKDNDFNVAYKLNALILMEQNHMGYILKELKNGDEYLPITEFKAKYGDLMDEVVYQASLLGDLE